MHVIDAEHNPPGRSLRKAIIIVVRIIFARVLPLFNPDLCSFLETLEEILRYPVAQDEIAIFVEETYLLL